jgi:hypothetical protein
MTPSVRAEIAGRDGDLPVLLLLGIANWFLFLDHVPHNMVSSLSLRNFGFSGAADLFVFVGGYGAALIYSDMMLERGFVVAATRIFRRVWQLYAAYVVLFVIYVDLIGYVATQTAAPEIIAEFNITGFIDHPIRTLIHGLLLQAKPLNLDVLQLFIPLMAFLAFALFGMLRWPSLTWAGSIVLYLAARVFDWNLSSFPEGRWDLNPFSWQLLFVLGIWLAVNGSKYAGLLRSMQRITTLRVAALLYAVFALVITSAGKSPELARMIPDSVLSVFLPNDKETLAPYRVLHLLTLAFLFTLLVPRDRRGFPWQLLVPVVKCGEQWLAVFCAGVFLSFAAHFALITGPNSLAMQVLVSLSGLSAMAGVAYYVSWSKRQDDRSAPAVRAHLPSAEQSTAKPQRTKVSGNERPLNVSS